MATEWWDKPYWRWEKRSVFETNDGRRMYPLFTPANGGAGSIREGKVWVYDIDVDPLDPNLEHAVSRSHRVGFLDWDRDRITYVETGRVVPRVDEPSWERQGIAREMLRLAQEISPDLLHAVCKDRVSDVGEAFVRSTNPEQACNNDCGEGCRKRSPLTPSENAPPVGFWLRIKDVLGSGCRSV